ncbi:MAG TPA: HNH endonuclease signature motif containing protein [Gemmataceae bacterium]|jgi:hypothetical protein
MNPHYQRIAERAGHRCEYCHAPEAVFNFPFEVEHVIPVARQGQDTDDNRCLACRSCNLHKSDHLTGLDPETGTEIHLFDPRQDSWADHFEVEADTGAILGRTATGRATTARMQMNSPPQLAARQMWKRLGLFP